MPTLTPSSSLSTKEMQFLIEKYYALIEDMEDSIAISEHQKRKTKGTQEYMTQDDQNHLFSSLLS